MSVYISHQYSVVFLSHIQFRACMVRNIWRYTSVDLSLKCSMSRLVSLYDCRLVVIFLFPFTSDSLFFPFTTVGLYSSFFHLRLSGVFIFMFPFNDDPIAFIFMFPLMTVCLHLSCCFHSELSGCIHLFGSIYEYIQDRRWAWSYGR